MTVEGHNTDIQTRDIKLKWKDNDVERNKIVIGEHFFAST